MTKTYTLISFENGGMNSMDDRATFTEKAVAMVALSLSNDKSALMVDEVEDGEISGWQKINGKIEVFSVKGEPWLNLALLYGTGFIKPLEETSNGVTVKISASRIHRTLQDVAKVIDLAQTQIEKGKQNGTQQVRV